MFLNFQLALTTLGADAAFRIANAARPASDYLFNSILPERNVASYHVDSGNIIVRATMAGLTGMDSPYPPGGQVEISTFLEQTAKIANRVPLTEAALRQMQDFVMRLQLGGGNTTEAIVQNVLNFLNKVIIQSHLDRMEWLRGEALVQGNLLWTMNNKTLSVAYGVPAANFLTHRAGTAGYGGSASVFWSDVRALRKALRNNVRAFIAHPDTIDMIRYNSVNALTTIAESDSTVTFQRYIGGTPNIALSPDSADRVTIVSYGREGEVLNPAAAPGAATVIVPFMPRGKLLAIGNNTQSAFIVGTGSTEDPDDANALGYTHLAPTIEGNGAPGRWAQLYTPENEPWSLVGRGVTNGLPVITAPEKIAVGSTDMV